MTTESRDMFSTSHVARELGVGVSMARRYGLLLERVRGEPLPQVPGRGRLYSSDDLRILQAARAQLLENPQTTLDDALRDVLGIAPEPESLAAPDAGQRSRPGASLAVADVQAAVAPLVAAVQALQAETAELREQLRQQRGQLPAGETTNDQTRRLLELYRQQMQERDAEIERLRARRSWWPFGR